MTTVGILVGLMFLALGVENIALSTLDVPGRRWDCVRLSRQPG